MARVTGPLFSVSASGTVGKAFTFGIWKGIQYVREWFKPANPKTAKQVNVRDALTLAVAYWQSLPGAEQDKWDTYAEGTQMTGFNQLVRRGMNAYVLDPGVDVAPTNCAYVGEPGAEAWTWNAP